MSDRNATGRLHLVHGSMFAGKTEHLIALLRREQAGGKTVIAFKHRIDDRYDPDHLVTHSGERFAARRVPDAAAILTLCGTADIVAVDEGHFFGLPLIAVVQTLRERGKTVIVAALTNDAWGRPFEPTPQLATLADEEIILRAPCRVCGEPAPFNQRMVPVQTPHMIGGLNEYEPRCAAHFTPLPDPPEQR